MEIYIDSADIREIKTWMAQGIIDGVTTNPTIILKDGISDVDAGIKTIAELIDPLPLSAEVTTNDLEEMKAQARYYHSLAPNIVIKIPQENQYGVPCYGVMHELENEGIKVNATAGLSFGQVILSAKAGATYISLFAGRIGDEGGDPAEVIRNSVSWLEHWDFHSRIIVGSIRSVGDILQAALAGAHIITIPPQFIKKMGDHQYTRETVAQFVRDAETASKPISKVSDLSK